MVDQLMLGANEIDLNDTLPEANIFAPENGGPLEKQIPIGNHHFQVPR